MGELLEQLRGLTHPVILTGDFNTSGRNSTPGKAHRALLKLTARGPLWSHIAPTAAPVLGWLNDFLKGGSQAWEIERDPTRPGQLTTNEEHVFFEALERFRFHDGGCFDFRGDPDRTVNGLAGRLANSNERTNLGFVPTSETPWACGPVGRSKLDWILVKPYLKDPQDAGSSYRFAPHFGRTLCGLRELSDHRPMLVDLPFDEP
jgi:endonuclease/exonuclease/phosphatase family metal-dependent hydrolase